MEKQIILSFDYELFFGENSGTVENTLINPTNIMLDYLDSIGARASYFVDFLMLKHLKIIDDSVCRSDLIKIKRQLQNMVRRGHRVELHLHPHWVDAKYNGDGRWDFSNFNHYSIMTFSESEIDSFFREGISIISSVLEEVDPNYKMIAFRAGGWAVSPFSKLANSFSKYNIRIDSSVGKGIKLLSDYRMVDFSQVPNLPFYLIKNDVLQVASQGPFWEVPISTFKINFVEKLINRILKTIKRDKFRRITDGSHKRKIKCDVKYSFFEKLRVHISSSYYFFSLSYFSPFIIWWKCKMSKSKFLVFIDHPKDFSYSNLMVLQKISRKNKFITYLDMYNNQIK